MGKGNKSSKKSSNDTTLISKNQVLTNNKISQNSVLKQLSKAPAPTDKGKSGYPHKYLNFGGLFRKRKNSSTTSYYEYPVQQSGIGYNFGSKPKDDPGPYRGITNQNKTYKGTICHNGDKKTNNTNAGRFHLCKQDGQQ